MESQIFSKPFTEIINDQFLENLKQSGAFETEILEKINILYQNGSLKNSDIVVENITHNWGLKNEDSRNRN